MIILSVTAAENALFVTALIALWVMFAWWTARTKM